MDFKLDIDKLKRHVFYEIIDMAGRVYVVVRYSEGVKLGNRGFTKEEKTGGIVLAFNPNMNFNWIDGAITAKLSFGTTIERCYIPSEDIVVVFSPDVNIRFIADVKEDVYAQRGPSQRSVSEPKSKDAALPRKKQAGESNNPKVIEVDFTKKRK